MRWDLLRIWIMLFIAVGIGARIVSEIIGRIADRIWG